MIYQSSRGSGRFRTGREVLWPFQINMDSPEAEGLLLCFVAARDGMVNLIDGTQGTRAGTADPMRGNDAGGLDAYFDGNADQYQFGTSPTVNVANDYTIVWESYLDAIGNVPVTSDTYPGIAIFARGASDPLRIGYSSDTAYDDIYVGTRGGFQQSFLLPSGITKTGVRHWGVLTSIGGTRTAWVNGQACTATTSGSLAVITDDTRIGGTSGTTSDFLGSIRQVRFYERSWTADEALAFFLPQTRDQLFAPRRRRIYLPAAPAAGADAAASAAGTSTATSTGASIAASAATAAGTGSATATGAALVAAAAYSAGVATGAAEGVEVTAGGTIASGAASSAGVSTAEAAGTSIAEAAASSAGTSTARAVGADASAVATVRHEGVRRRRIVQQLRAIHEDDEELAMLIAAALPILQAKHGCGVRVR